MKLNLKRYVMSAIVVFVFVFLYEWLFHGMLMGGMYAETAELWRSQADMQSKFHWMLIGQALFALTVSYIFTRGYEGRGLMEGVRFGILITLFTAGPQLVMYAVAPHPGEMVIYWMLGALLELVLIGMILSTLYKPAENA